ncbi:MAG: Methionine--tRNA ligase [Chlamydiae bacterium]|nr:Methionine--tRNA ligase [Chlamydiota bacterium]
MNEKILITSALLYGNGPLHFGHMAGSYLPAECYARFMRFTGHEVLFLSGLDEYGAAITLSAEKEKQSPQAHVDHYYKEAIKDFERFDFSFDHFSRTTWPRHKEAVVEFFQDLASQSYVEKVVTKQLYSEKDKKFLADRYVQGICPKCKYQEARGDECPKCGASFEANELIEPKSKLTKSSLTLKETEHFFLKLDLFKEQLKEWLSQKKWKPQVLNMAKQYVEDARPRCITRDLNWGIPVPNEEGKVFYVWFDAPIGYISAAKDWAEKNNDPNAWEKFWLDPKTKYVQFVGKDNIPFHSVFFPAMVMGQKRAYKQVDELPANAFFHYEGKKFSKSEGWFIELDDFFKSYSSDQIRYCLAANAPEQDDSEFSWKDFQSRNNAELVGKFGNFINRTLVFIAQRAEGKIPELKDSTVRDKKFLEDIQVLTDKIKEAHFSFHLRKSTQLIMELATCCNVYFDELKPWQLAKEDVERMKAVLAHCLVGIKALSVAAYAIIPKAANKIWNMIGFDDHLTSASFDERLKMPLNAGSPINKPEILFQKIEDKQVQKELDKLKCSQSKDDDSMIDFDSFSKVDLRVAEVLQAEQLPKSQKLLRIELDVGGERRVVVSGIKEHYNPEDLLGKKVILVANLKPAKIMGIESQGMILAASDGKMLEMPLIENLPSGSRVS